ncbi:DMT family transporter [Desulfopila sp. IMCC35008]|uniref:DMT family transporter n=1 Tax=Desulfopila sp. IMCC35008 TaxID=2653858 RepID=UPI0013D88138|nr:DMT family transporter [Desulfopila sp. IMCC35008]
MTERPRSLFFIHLLMVICATLVSTSFTVCAAVSNALDPLVLTFIRFIMASLLLLPVVMVRFELHLSASLFFRSSVISSCLVLFFWCMFLSLRYTTALNTSVIFAIVPVISWGYSMVLLKERIGRAQSVALFLGMAGAIWVIFRGNPLQLVDVDLNRGDLIFLAGCFAMGLYTPLIKLLYRGEPMLVLTFWILVTGTIWLGLFGAGKILATGWSSIPLSIWGWVGYLAFFTTVVTFFLTQYCILFIGPTRAMAYSYLYPCLVLLQDLALGKGMPPPAIIPGIVIVLAAMVVLQYTTGRLGK